MKKNAKTELNFSNILYHPTKNKVSVLMVISIDQSYQNGEYFADYCRGINKVKDIVASITFVETGNLKRHYELLKGNDSEKAAVISAQKLGKAWQDNNQKALNTLLVPYEVKHWHEITGHVESGFQDKDYAQGFNRVSKIYQSDDVYKKLVDKISAKHALKLFNELKQQNISVSFDDCLEASKCYLLEESAIIFKFVKMGFDYQMYPGRSNPALSYIYKMCFGETDPLPWKRNRFKGENHTLPSKTKSDASAEYSNIQPHNPPLQNSWSASFFAQNRVTNNYIDDNYELRQTFDFIIRNTTLTKTQQKILVQEFLKSIVKVQTLDVSDDNDSRKDNSPTEFVY